MKKILLTSLIISTTLLHSDEPTLNLQIVKQFSIGNTELDLGFVNALGDQTRYHPSIGFTHGMLTIDDYVNKRIIRYDRNFKTTEYIDYSFKWFPLSYHLADFSFGNTFSTYSDGEGIYLFDKQMFSFVTMFENLPESIMQLSNFKSFYYYGNILFIHDKDRKIWSIPEPSLNQMENRQNLLNSEQTKALIFKKWGSTGEVTVDVSDRLFIQGNLKTKDFKTFINYYKERNAGKTNPALKINPELPNELSGDNRFHFMGNDSNGSFYWTYAGDTIYIYNSSGWITKVIKYDFSRVWFFPAVSPEGDIYCIGLDSSNKKINIYMIKRSW